MKLKTLGCVELNSVAVGIHTADEMLKSALVELIIARPTCPGRYLIMVSGDTGSVKTAVDTGKQIGGDLVIDWFVLSSIHPSVIPALNAASDIREIAALGVIETYSSASCILAADAAAKAGQVELIEIRIASGLAGKSYVTLTGDVSSVQSSVQAGIEGMGNSGPVVSHLVIPSPSPELKKTLF